MGRFWNGEGNGWRKRKVAAKVSLEMRPWSNSTKEIPVGASDIALDAELGIVSIILRLEI